ncbi:hypothetical protein MCHI_002953 [Candidatus Magnetoovum chiemensis]|nr:hypothetical protein MCHI_002953 [Candidatus Magnetoovum chiemensis]
MQLGIRLNIQIYFSVRLELEWVFFMRAVVKFSQYVDQSSEAFKVFV